MFPVWGMLTLNREAHHGKNTYISAVQATIAEVLEERLVSRSRVLTHTQQPYTFSWNDHYFKNFKEIEQKSSLDSSDPVAEV